jgi:hypothetical protein
VRRCSTASTVGLALVLGVVVASATPVANTGTSARPGRPPGPARGGVAPLYRGTFANPKWGGWILLALTPDGRSVMNVGGIAPGVCEDEDFGHLVAGRDGATGPTFDIFLPARIRPDGSFAHSESRKGKRSPYRPATSAIIKGTFNGDTVRGTLRASTTTPFDRCSANVSFKARRIQ